MLGVVYSACRPHFHISIPTLPKSSSSSSSSPCPSHYIEFIWRERKFARIWFSLGNVLQTRIYWFYGTTQKVIHRPCKSLASNPSPLHLLLRTRQPPPAGRSAVHFIHISNTRINIKRIHRTRYSSCEDSDDYKLSSHSLFGPLNERRTRLGGFAVLINVKPAPPESGDGATRISPSDRSHHDSSWWIIEIRFLSCKSRADRNDEPVCTATIWLFVLCLFLFFLNRIIP